MFRAWFVGCLIMCSATLSAFEYTAVLTGIPQAKMRTAIEKASLTLRSEKNSPSMNALRLHANADIERIKNVAVYFGYYDCTVDVVVTQDVIPSVEFVVKLGDQFLFHALTLVWSDQSLVEEDTRQRASEHLVCKGPSPEDAPSFAAQSPALGAKILAIDKEIQSALRSRAFAFTKIVRKEVFADSSTKTIDILVEVVTGPIVRFGSTSISGADRSKNALFSSHQLWHKGDLYSPKLLEQTEASLLRSGIFQSVQLEEGSTLEDDTYLPISITVTESKPRTLGAGLNYTSTFGPGVSVEWEHRNLFGVGQKVSTQVQLWQRQRLAALTYTLPHFYRTDQDMLWIFEYNHQHYLPFTSSSYTGSALLDRQLTETSDILYGITLQRLESWRIIHNTTYHLVKVPVQFRWSCANSPLDPTHGFTFNIRLTPSYQTLRPVFSYLIQNTTVAGYTSLADDMVTLATKIGIANISGGAKNEVPLPDRFFGGSENTLRGYKTGSVSPRNKKGQPIGGYSMVTASFEVRARTQKSLGWVLFYDIGNVYRERIPQPQKHPLLQSGGIGLRYATPIGPLRLDVACPFNRRRHIDPPFQIYFSIGQAF